MGIGGNGGRNPDVIVIATFLALVECDVLEGYGEQIGKNLWDRNRADLFCPSLRKH